MTYYHVSSYAENGDIYKVGEKPLKKYIDRFSTLNADNYAAFINSCDSINESIFDKTGWRKSKWLCELIFESIRKDKYKNAPRRMYSVYLCNSLDEACMFNEQYRNGTAKTFEVDLDGYVHSFDMKLFTKAEELLNANISNINEALYNKIKLYAFEYWSQKIPMQEVEHLFEGTVVLKII